MNQQANSQKTGADKEDDWTLIAGILENGGGKKKNLQKGGTTEKERSKDDKTEGYASSGEGLNVGIPRNHQIRNDVSRIRQLQKGNPKLELKKSSNPKSPEIFFSQIEKFLGQEADIRLAGRGSRKSARIYMRLFYLGVIIVKINLFLDVFSLFVHISFCCQILFFEDQYKRKDSWGLGSSSMLSDYKNQR